MKTLINVTPVSEFRTVEEAFERLFNGYHRPSAPATSLIPIDVTEVEGKLVIRASVPGIDPNELDIQVENNVLTLRGEAKSAHEGGEGKVYRRELAYGAFARSLRLPENLDLNAIDAEFKNGVVTVTLPRIVEEKPKALKVNVRQAETTAN